MRRLLPLALGLALATTALSGCSTDEGDDQTTIVAAFYPLAWASEQVAGGHLTVDNLTSPGAEPHDLELSIRQTKALRDSALVVFLSDFQPAVDKAVDNRAEGEVLDAAEAADLLPFAEEEHDHGEHGESEGEADHDHGELDPHFWQDPMRLADVADAIADRLGAIDPDNAAAYDDNAADLRQRLSTLDQEYADGLASCEIDTIVASHDAFGYLGKYGLHVDSILGLSPEAEPTAASLAELRDLIEQEGITTVFSERLASAQASEALAREAGVETAVLDPIEGLSDETSDEDYLSLMRSNLAALQKANRC